MSKEDAVDEHLKRMDLVVTEHLKGSSPEEIVRHTGLTRTQVGALLKEWRTVASNSEAIKSRALQALSGADKHYDKLIKKAYSAMDDAEDVGALGQRIAAIKLIADMEAKRIDLLQKAGVLENDDVAKRLVETERKQKILVDILQSVVGKCDKCRPQVMTKLSQATDGMVVLSA